MPYMEVYTVAHAWVLFEKLIHKMVVKKSNRKIMSAMCLLIAFKSTEAYGGYALNEEKFARLKQDLIQLIGYRPRQRFIFYELKVLSKLNFHITVPLKTILTHMHSIFTMIETTLSDYLGEEAYNEYLR